MKRMTDDEIMDETYNRLFGDLDQMRSGSMFNDDDGDFKPPVPNAESSGISGVSVEIKPLMDGAQEGAKPDDIKGMPDEEEDRLKGISDMSPLMAQMHRGR